MPISTPQRQAILRAAKRWLGARYDHAHADDTWRDPTKTPMTFDCSSFVCRVAMDSLGYAPSLLAADAGWLIDNLVEVGTPAPGDLVGYGRKTTLAEAQRLHGRGALWHVMIYSGNGIVIGACDLAGKVVERSIEYERSLGARRWECVGEPPAPFRRLEVRRASS